MRIVRLLLRKKGKLLSLSQAVKAVTNCRIPGRKYPMQLHLGYLPLRFTEGVPTGQREKLTKNLRKQWKLHFGNEEVSIDWEDAEIKIAALRDSLQPVTNISLSIDAPSNREKQNEIPPSSASEMDVGIPPSQETSSG